MRNKKMRLTLGLLALMLMLILAACAGNNTDEANSSEANNETETGGNDAEEAVEFTIMGQFSQAQISETDEILFDNIEEATNTQISFDIPPSTGYAERQQLMLSTGELPDLVYFSSPSNATFLNAVNDGVIIPVNEYLENAENVLEYSYDVSWDALRVNNDENIYGLPRTSVIRSDAYWVRKDWLDNLNITIPENNEITIEEMTDILRKFSKEDPDQNGIDDTYGLGHYASGDKSLNPVFLNEFGFYGWQESDGEYPYMSAQFDVEGEEYAKSLEFSAQLYTEGLMDPDAPLLDGSTALQRFLSGITGVYAGFAGNYEMLLTDGQEINPDFDLEYVFVKNVDGEQKGLGQGTGLYGLWAITSEADNPQRIVDVFDYMLSDEGWDMIYHGIEGYDYTEENGERVYAEEPLETIVRSRIVRRSEDYMFFINPAMPEEEQQLLVPNIQKAVDRMVLSKDRGYVPNVARTPEYLDFEKRIAEIKTRIILGDAPVEEYSNILQEWQDQFGEEYFSEMNDYIQKMESQS